ncbi:hypothetical protein, conserved [Angomonas deanei]|uniref:Frag1/DRAM/Sfk1 family n=1 Tax=Angomonas deanei TaxID=59799 RepID=A0A7G2CI02_9TRYP|nr:hypothetical protein, conserved [Angomonas deanei]
MESSQNSREASVSVVRDTSEYLDVLLRKGAEARWVMGLTPEDVAPDVQPEETAPSRRLPNGFSLPLILMGCYIGGIALDCAQMDGSESLLFSFPSEELTIWPYCRREGEGLLALLTRVAPVLVIPSVFAIVSVFLISLRIGCRVQHFQSLCGVGISILSFISLVGQFFLLYFSCGTSTVSKEWECDASHTLFWLCSVFRVGGPLAVVCCVSPVMDFFAGTGRRWLLVSSIPLLVFTAAVVSSVAKGEVATSALQLTYYSTIFSWSLISLFLWRSNPVYWTGAQPKGKHDD